MEGKVVLVTGATSGLGLASAEGFARLGARVHLLARNATRGERSSAQVRANAHSSDVHFGVCDLSDLSAVRSFAERFSADVQRLDVLVNNAGALVTERTLSVDGFELTLATNVLGPFLLTKLLCETLKASAPARVVNVSSGGMYTQRVELSDLQSADAEYDGPIAYARTKRAQVMLTEVAAERLAGTGVVVHAMHPGWVDTPGLQASLPGFYRATKWLLRTPQQGADTIVWLGSSPKAARSSGGFWHDRRERPTHRLPKTKQTRADREALWEQCERLTGLGAATPPSHIDDKP
jgi:NAD(P)-dependent dehydrogenase (short-subunit alcohol dehydrogenase family)